MLKFKKEKERIKKIGQKEGAKQKTVEMAKVMKKDGKSISEIMRYTQLSRKEFERL